MIFYFSGTNNSKYIADEIGTRLEVSVVSIADEMRKSARSIVYELHEGELVGFVFPVYAWAPPKIVTEFVKTVEFRQGGDNYFFSVCTCGDDAGNCMKRFDKTLRKKDITLNSTFSITMPNNYIVDFDVDSELVQAEKIAKAENRVGDIVSIIKQRKKDVYDVKVGPYAFLRTNIVSVLFDKFAINPKKFHATDKCIGCKKCEKYCPRGNIHVDQKPRWGTECSFCMVCINVCPVRAIEYGQQTKAKGRYWKSL